MRGECVVCEYPLRDSVAVAFVAVTASDAVLQNSNYPPAHPHCAEFWARSNPRLCVVWGCNEWTSAPECRGYDVGPPLNARWFVGDRAATRAEVMLAAREVMPQLKVAADRVGPEALSVLVELARDFTAELPPPPPRGRPRKAAA